MMNRTELLQDDDIRDSISDHVEDPVGVDLSIAAATMVDIVCHDAGGGHTCLAAVM